MWEAFASVISSPNFLQGGGIIVALALVGANVYQNIMQMRVLKEFDERSDAKTKDCQTRVESIVTRTNQALDRTADAHLKFAEEMSKHNAVLSHLTNTIESRL